MGGDLCHRLFLDGFEGELFPVRRPAPPELFGKAAVSGVSAANSHFMLKMFESKHLRALSV